MRFAFIDAWKEEWFVEYLCSNMQVTSRGFRAWRLRPISQCQCPSNACKHVLPGSNDRVLLAYIREQYCLSMESYGRPLMTEELQELNLNVGHRRFGLLMRGNGIKIIRTQKY